MYIIQALMNDTGENVLRLINIYLVYTKLVLQFLYLCKRNWSRSCNMILFYDFVARQFSISWKNKRVSKKLDYTFQSFEEKYWFQIKCKNISQYSYCMFVFALFNLLNNKSFNCCWEGVTPLISSRSVHHCLYFVYNKCPYCTITSFLSILSI
jgi:hypothetical protein